MTLSAGTRLGPYEIRRRSAPAAWARSTAPRPAAGPRGRRQGPAGRRSLATPTAAALRAARPAPPASLNHPNILAVYDVGTHEDAPYVVIGAARGRDAAPAPGSRRPLPPRKAVDVRGPDRRAASAAAHDKGIVHRDLKPENLFLTRDGRRQDPRLRPGQAGAADEGPSPRPSDLPDGRPTEPGASLGTVGYMAPEQVRGEPVDAPLRHLRLRRGALRDAHGRARVPPRLRGRDDDGDPEGEPPELPRATDVPPALERIVRHCLEKNPEERFQSAHDLAFDLEALSGRHRRRPPRPGERGAAGSDRPRRRLVLLSVAAVALLVGRDEPSRIAHSALPPSDLRKRRRPVGPVRPRRRDCLLHGAEWEERPMEIFVSRPEAPSRGPSAWGPRCCRLALG